MVPAIKQTFLPKVKNKTIMKQKNILFNFFINNIKILQLTIVLANKYCN